tara:strand:+ start:185 stop:430 length:246 start_codon:yes stop_codon:yes gene_type:complete
LQRPPGKAEIVLNFTTVKARNNANSISIFDSGPGGLTVLESVQKQLLDLDIIYLGDHKYAPYGGIVPMISEDAPLGVYRSG